MNNNSENIVCENRVDTIKNINFAINNLNNSKTSEIFLQQSIKLFTIIETNIVYLEGSYNFFQSLVVILKSLKGFEGEEKIEKYNHYINLFDEKSRVVTPKTLRKIGYGSYGDVYETGLDTVTKVMDNKLSNLVEIFFLKSFENSSNDFIPKIKNIKFTKDKIELDMNNCGMNLLNYSKSISYMERLKMIPSLMIQMARFLLWMKSHNIAHMDIKPDNICIHNGKLTFIDWGFVGPVCCISPCYVGTYNYADPNYLESIKKISYEYDMFSCGITILVFLCKDYLQPGYNFREDLNFMLSKIQEDVCNVVGYNYMAVLRRMVELKERSRITPLQLYYNSALINLQIDYPVLKEAKKYIQEEKDNEDEIDIISLLCVGSDILKSQSIEFNNNHLYDYSFNLFSKLKNIPKKNISEYSLCCLYIYNIIFYSRTIHLLPLEESVNYFNNKYTCDQFKSIIIDICESINWQVYPEKF